MEYYYSALLMGDGATDTAGNRTTATTSCVRPFVILTPEAVDYFPVRSFKSSYIKSSFS